MLSSVSTTLASHVTKHMHHAYCRAARESPYIDGAVKLTARTAGCHAAARWSGPLLTGGCLYAASLVREAGKPQQVGTLCTCCNVEQS